MIDSTEGVGLASAAVQIRFAAHMFVKRVKVAVNSPVVQLVFIVFGAPALNLILNRTSEPSGHPP